MSTAGPLAPAEAAAIVRDAAPSPTSEFVLVDEALGRVLAADLTSLCDHPNVDNSALDGYACRIADTATATPATPVVLRLIGESSAGHAFQGEVRSGQAVRIFTGAALPAGADGIVPVETSRESPDRLETVQLSAPARGQDVRRKGQDLVAGQVYLHRGRRLDAASVGLAAGMGHGSVSVARRPRVALLATGDEVVSPGRSLARGQVYDSNGSSLLALGRAAGADLVRLPPVGDDLDALPAALEQAGSVDLLLTSGGVSMGRYDVVRDLLFERGTVVFWKIAMKPGGPALFGRLDGTPVLGLPGNPVSSMVVFLVLARAFIDAALGRNDPPPYFARREALAGARLRATPAKENLQRVQVHEGPSGAVVTPFENQSSGVLRSMATADALAIVPPGKDVPEGGRVEIIPLAAHLR